MRLYGSGVVDAPTRGRRWIIAAAVLVPCLGSSACRADRAAARANGDDPLAALAAPLESRRYTTAYWVEQADRATALWTRAVAYCDAARAIGQAPINCGAVITARFERSIEGPASARPPHAPPDRGGRP
jgi:hypothetical protein